MYNIYRGYIQEPVFQKNKDGVTSYKIKNASSSMTGQKNLLFNNIKHGFMTDPANSAGLYPNDTLVYFIADASGDGAILAAVEKNSGLYKNMPKEELDIPSVFENSDIPPITPGDFFLKKLEGWFLYAYTGLLHLRSKLGTEILMNPIKEKIELKSKRFRYSIGEHGAIEFNLSNTESNPGKANFNMFLFSDASEQDPNRVFFNFKLGEHEEPNNKLTFDMFGFDANEPKLITSFSIDYQGNILVKNHEAKCSVNITKDGSINIESTENDININGSGGKLKLHENKVAIGNDDNELLDLLENLLNVFEENSQTFTQGGALNPIIKQKIMSTKSKLNNLKANFGS